MNKFCAWLRANLWPKSDAQKFEDGARYVYDTIKNAHLSTKEELQPIAEKLWRECYPSWEGDHPFDNGMQEALTKMGFANPAFPNFEDYELQSPLRATPLTIQIPSFQITPQPQNFWADLPHDNNSRRGMSRDLTGEMLLQLADDHLYDAMQMLPQVSEFLPMPNVTPPRSPFANKYKTLEHFFNSNTVK